jgi:two-component system, OmpR family, phosphate regulon sensor histidine kinase PhoR
MFSFRQKILIAYLVVFLLFLAGMYPFATRTVQKIATKAMYDRSQELIEKIQTAPNDEALIRRLKEQKALVFFRISVINNERKVLYDSHTKRILGPRFSQEYVVEHVEVLEAFKTGRGYNEDYSKLLGQKFAYLAIAFDFHGKQYALRTAFPYKYVTELTHDFETGVIALAGAVLLLFSLMTWFIINHLTSPIQQIIKAIIPFQSGKTNVVPMIELKNLSSTDEFVKLADTLNSLSIRIQKHIANLEQERNEKEAILESLGEGVIAVDVNMIITYANNMASKLLENNHLVGQSFNNPQNQILHSQKFLTLLQNCQIQNKVLTDTQQMKNDSQKIFLDIVAAPKKGNSGAILVLQDKTSHYKLLEMRKDFIANASHELKTPITIIRGFAETLHDNPDLPPDTFKEVTAKIVRNCTRMTNLIKDLLTLTDVENLPESRLMECDLYEIIKNCGDSIKEVHRDAHITVEKPEDEDMYLVADANLLEHAFINLIDNAAKYSKPPAQIHITMRKEKDKIIVRVADQGIGIPEADLDQIFHRFYTVDKAHSRKLGGSGLGLSIVETIIEKHFGKISVISEVGKGTTFTVILPTTRITS